MAVPPKFAGHKLEFGPPAASTSSVPSATHTFELYVDYCCPFSGRIFNTLTTQVFPAIRENPAWAGSLAVVFRQQVQPWHPSSTLMHEAGLAVLRLAPEKFWAFSGELFAAQKDFFDINVVNETRNQTYRRLAKVAAKVGVSDEEVYKLLAIPEKGGDDGALNTGNAVTNDLKVVTKMNRLVGVHVTPTVVFDGVVQDTSSGWTLEQWKEFFTKNIAPVSSIGNTSHERATCDRSKAGASSDAAELAKQQARVAAATAGSKRYAANMMRNIDVPERLLIYHAGTGRITFLAMVKVTTLFLGAFFTFVVVPGYVKAEKPEWETVGVALCGLIPLVFVAYTTSPFVTHIYIHLPPAARTSRPVLERFVHGALPPSTELTLTTMSAIAKPRYSTMQAGHLRPAERRFGIVNYVRDAEGAMAENETRRWYNLRAMTKFGVQEARAGKERKKKAEGKKSMDLTEPWIWDALKGKIEKRAAANRGGPSG
ncbi:hypothetical protein Trco_002775 [Trichoderma cornu-damae]|uniref:Thioredoxin-like fold domain-containing protein n=1 Tax=Trichoderma cornu-damae TaxID=654480 RepID=A0A9P8TZF8_9HYPO|nr:hypothetical protein Trco_002775 [Trichoderma cornu-damae]